MAGVETSLPRSRAALLSGLFWLSFCVSPAEAHFQRPHPALADAPRITRTGRGLPGDPVNLAFVGTEDELEVALLSAGWVPADPITLRSTLRIAAGTVFRRAYVDAPVSNLFLFGRKQDLAFEAPAGKDPRRRHHVRFWQAPRLDDAGRPLWLGAATFDARVGLNKRTGGITHRIAPDVDTERDKLVDDVRATRYVADVYSVEGFHKKREGHNGGGDRWVTDGRLSVLVLGGGRRPSSAE